jgi:hypothetical protein
MEVVVATTGRAVSSGSSGSSGMGISAVSRCGKCNYSKINDLRKTPLKNLKTRSDTSRQSPPPGCRIAEPPVPDAGSSRRPRSTPANCIGRWRYGQAGCQDPPRLRCDRRLWQTVPFVGAAPCGCPAFSAAVGAGQRKQRQGSHMGLPLRRQTANARKSRHTTGTDARSGPGSPPQRLTNGGLNPGGPRHGARVFRRAFASPHSGGAPRRP